MTALSSVVSLAMHCQHLSPHRPEFTSTRLTMVSLAALRPVCYMYMYIVFTVQNDNSLRGHRTTGKAEKSQELGYERKREEMGI